MGRNKGDDQFMDNRGISNIFHLCSHIATTESCMDIRIHLFNSAFGLFLSLAAEYSFSDCARPEADPGPASAVAVHEQELQAGQGHHPAPARPCCGGQPCEAAQEGGQTSFCLNSGSIGVRPFSSIIGQARTASFAGWDKRQQGGG